MPQVPNDRVQTVTPNGPATPYIRVDAGPEAFGAAEAVADQKLGQAIQGAGDVTADAAVRFQKVVNETTVDDAYATKFSPAFREKYQQFYSLQGKDALDKLPTYVREMEDLAKTTTEGLTNSAQRHQFQQTARRRVQMELDSMSRYAEQQNKVWMAQTSDAFLKNQLDQAADFYNDEVKFGAALGAGIGEIDKYAAQTGQSGDVARDRASKFISAAYVSRVQRMLNDDPFGARDLYRANVNSVDQAARAPLEHQIKSATMPIEARNLADAAMSGRPTADVERLVPAAIEPLVQAVVQKESAGRADAESPKGAKGLMQLMPDTARGVAKRLGIEFNEEKLKTDPEYNRQLGTAYLKEMLGRYGGNQSLALAAYNAGPARVDKWLAKIGNPNLGQISNEEFVAKIPFAETKDYVSKINAKVPQRDGTMPTALDIRAHLGAWIATGEKLSFQMHPDDPVFRDMVSTRIQSYVGQVATAQDAVQRQARSTIMTTLFGDGESKVTSLEQLLSTPAAKQAWSTMDGMQQTAVLGKIEANANKAKRTLTEESAGEYYRLKGLALSNPEDFVNTDLTKHLKSMPDTLWHELVQEQTRMSTREARDAQKALNQQHALAVARPALLAAGVYDPRAKAGSTKAATYDQFVGRYVQQLDQFIANNKRRPNDKELGEITNSLLTVGAQSGSGWLFGMGPDSKTRAFQVEPGQFYVPVPKAEKAKITDEWTRMRGHPPTDAQVQQVYTISQMKKGAK